MCGTLSVAAQPLSTDTATAVVLPFHGPMAATVRARTIRAARGHVTLVGDKSYYHAANQLHVDPYDADGARLVCRQIGCDLIVRGTVSKRGNSYWITNRMLSGHTGELLGTCEQAASRSGLAATSRRLAEECLTLFGDSHRETDISTSSSPNRATLVQTGATNPPQPSAPASSIPPRHRASIGTVASQETGSLVRLALRSTLGTDLNSRLGMKVGGGGTMIQQHGTSVVEQGHFGLELKISWQRTSLAALAAGYLQRERFAGQRADQTVEAVTTFSPAGGVALGHRLSAGVDMNMRIHLRPFMELSQPVATDEQMFYAAGVAGASALEQTRNMKVTEVQASLRVTPSAITTLHGDARAFRISDGNSGYTVWGGGQLDVRQLMSWKSRFRIVAVATSYVSSHQQTRPEYYSPQLLVTHNAGGRIQAHAGRVSFSGHGGLTLVQTDGWSKGWYAGAEIRVTRHRLSAALTAETRTVPYYTWRAAGLLLATNF